VLKDGNPLPLSNTHTLSLSRTPREGDLYSENTLYTSVLIEVEEVAVAQFVINASAPVGLLVRNHLP
jgi:hypothetical protein